MWKKVLTVTLTIVITIVFAACSSEITANHSGSVAAQEGDVTIDGGWEITENEFCNLPDNVQSAFDKATVHFTGSELKPVAYIANQVVAGMNYMIFCESETTTADPVRSYQVAIIYADLEGNAELTAVNEFDLTAYTEGSGTEINTEELSGGWSVPDDAAGSVIPEDAKTVFDKAVGTFTGSDLEPLALLGTQAVAGTNYAFLCKSTPTTQQPVSGIQIVTVYADLQGNAEIINIHTLDPAEYNK